jgi:hypothetical protein
MSKNPKFHHIIANDTWGLTEWYPNIKEEKEASEKVISKGAPPIANKYEGKIVD